MSYRQYYITNDQGDVVSTHKNLSNAHNWLATWKGIGSGDYSLIALTVVTTTSDPSTVLPKLANRALCLIDPNPILYRNTIKRGM